ncbi:glutamate--cysteine ligase [Paucibacter soli]
MRRGVEKESLRANADGSLALTPHPAALGSALKHPHITTDFSESQLELITGVHASAEACLAELTEIHQAVVHSLGGEMMWASSMPCTLPADETIPIGNYGSSNIGRAKSVYRMGLGHRYGRRMQTISGIHYNWSMPGITSEQYFDLIRNFRRHSFLLLMLFGASPALCSSFVEGRPHELQEMGAGTLYQPHATSLRMGRLGYQSDAQAQLAVSYNSLEGYAESLQGALTQAYPAYEAIGVRNPGGEYNQLSTSLLQIENEFYGTIRPKRVIKSGERPLHALRERGVEYVEVRCMDLDPFETVGINADTMRFIDIFLLHCLLADSPPDTPQEIAALARNQQRVAHAGRDPGQALERGEQRVTVQSWGLELLEAFGPIAAKLDRVLGGRAYDQALARARQSFADFDSLPSAHVLQQLRGEHDCSHVGFIGERSRTIKASLLALPISPQRLDDYARMALVSREQQSALERAEHEPFEAFRLRYLDSQQLLA